MKDIHVFYKIILLHEIFRFIILILYGFIAKTVVLKPNKIGTVFLHMTGFEY